MTTATKNDFLFLIEYYTKSGYIRMAWVDAASQLEAVDRLRTAGTDYRGMRINFGESILVTEQSEILDLRLGAPYRSPILLSRRVR